MNGETPFSPRGPLILLDTMWSGAGGPPHPDLAARNAYISMIETAQNVADRYGLTREEIDAFALRSHQHAAAARDSGRLAKEIHPIEIPATRTGRARVFEHDESVRSDTTLEKLASLPAQPNTTQMTAGNSTPLSDGASAVVVASDRAVAELSLDPLARVVSTATYALDPAYMGIAPAWAITAALRRAGLAPPPSTSGRSTRHSPPKPWAYCANWRTNSTATPFPTTGSTPTAAPWRSGTRSDRQERATFSHWPPSCANAGCGTGYSECASDPAKAWR